MQAFFKAQFPWIHSAAVPPSQAADRMYTPLIFGARGKRGQLVAALLSCRAQIAATTALLPPGAMPPQLDFSQVQNLHSELDLLAVDPAHRGEGIGSALIDAAAGRLRERGVRWWFGNVLEDMDVDRLRQFYGRHGFNVGAQGQPLPPLMGREWTVPTERPPAFYFWRRLD